MKISQYTEAYKFIKTYDSVTEAARAIGCGRSGIYRGCNNNSLVHGYRLCYAGDNPMRAEPKIGGQGGRAVVCVETKRRYTSQSSAARQTGVSRTSIVAACRDSALAAGGFHWAYAD